MDADVLMSRRDVETAALASAPVMLSPLSHCYFDVPCAEPSADPANPLFADRPANCSILISPEVEKERLNEPTRHWRLGLI
jgi:hypothetical protein